MIWDHLDVLLSIADTSTKKASAEDRNPRNPFTILSGRFRSITTQTPTTSSCEADSSPMLKPFPLARAHGGKRRQADQNSMEPLPVSAAAGTLR